MIGELHQTFTFPTGTSKAAWETVMKECRQIGVNRWRTPESHPADEPLITILAETEQRRSFNRAVRLCTAAGGRPIETPELALRAQRARRNQLAFEAAHGGPLRQVTRAPGGMVIDGEGRSHGPLNHPQG
jgi:hypothetical protein